MCFEQRLDLAAKLVVRPAGPVEERSAIGGGAIHGRVVDSIDLREALGRHPPVPLLANSR